MEGWFDLESGLLDICWTGVKDAGRLEDLGKLDDSDVQATGLGSGLLDICWTGRAGCWKIGGF